MGDRELLEWAAKAMGTKYVVEHFGHYVDALSDDQIRRWNPLTDDGSCARMEAMHMLNIKWYPFSVVASASAYDCTELYADHDRDRAKARRYAATRAAAEIGKATASAGEGV